MKIRKRMLKEVAKIYASNVVSAAMGSGAYTELLNEDEIEFLQIQLDKLALRISDANAATLDECVNLAILKTT